MRGEGRRNMEGRNQASTSPCAKRSRLVGIALLAALGCTAVSFSVRACGSFRDLTPRAQHEFAERPFLRSIAIAHLEGPVGAWFWSEGFPAFRWALPGQNVRASEGDSSANTLFFIALGLKEEARRVGFQDPPKRQRAGVPIYFVGAPANSVTVLNSETAAELGVVPVGTDPTGIAFAPDGSLCYVSNLGSDSVSVIDTDALSVADTITLAEGSQPYGVAVSPDGGQVYVVNSGLNSLSVIDATSRAVVATVPVGAGPFQVAVSPDGLLAYVPNSEDNTVTVLDTLTREPVTTIEDIPAATAVKFNHRGTRAYVTTATENSGMVHIVNTADHSVVSSIRVGANPRSIKLSVYGITLYTADQSADTVTIIDTRTEVRVDVVRVGSAPADIAPILD